MKHGISIKQFNKTDIAAIAVCLALFSYLIFAATIGFGSIDESFYYTIAQRQLMGDRLLIDEWHVSQLSSVLQLIPYWLVTTLVGSTEGVIINLRFFFLAVVLILYWFLYVRLREHGWIGLLAAALFSVYVPLAIMVLNYYTMSVQGLTVVGALLFLGREKKKWPVLILAGFVFACTVLCQPFLAFVYFFWCLLVLIRETADKKGRSLLETYGFFLNRRNWVWITGGIVMAAMLFFAFLLSQSRIPELVKAIPELFTDYEYGFVNGSGIKLLDFWKIRECFRFFGYFPPAALIVLSVLCVILKKTDRLEHWRKRLFFVAVLCLAAAYVAAIICVSKKDYRTYGPVAVYYFHFHGVPLLFFGLVCCLLRKKKDPRLFCFWSLGFLSSLMIDLSSDLVMGMGVAVTFAPTLLSLTGLISELRKEPVPAKKTVKKKKTFNKNGFLSKNKATAKKTFAKEGEFFLKNATALCLCVILSWEAFGVYSLCFFNVVEQMLDFSGARPPVSAVAERGPLKGVHTTEHVNNVYNDMLADLDVIKENTEGPVYVTELFSYCYLYLERPIATYSTWYVEPDSEARQMRYWELHPEKRPDYIYVPFFDAYYYKHYSERQGYETWGEDKLAFLKTVSDCEVTEGKAGFIVRVNGWLV